jgi:hypothetical protein
MQLPKLNNKGQSVIEVLILMPIIFIILFIAFTIIDSVQEDHLFPIVANLSGGYSTVIRTILEIVPLALVMLVLIVIVIAARGKTSGYPPSGF